MERMVREHISFYTKQHARLLANMRKNPWNVALLEQQIAAIQRVINALSAFPSPPTAQHRAHDPENPICR